MRQKEREWSDREMKLLFNQWWAVWRRAEVSTVIRYTRPRTTRTHTETGDWVSSLTRRHKPGGDRRGRSALPELSGEAKREPYSERLREGEGEGASTEKSVSAKKRTICKKGSGEATRAFSPDPLYARTPELPLAGDLLRKNAYGTVW